MTRQKRTHTRRNTAKPTNTGSLDAIGPAELVTMPAAIVCDDALPAATPPVRRAKIVDPATRNPGPTKLDRLIALLQRDRGAGLEELCSKTGWQAHSVRGAIAGSLKRKGYHVLSERTEGVRRYRIEGAP